jgi:Lrp/AsnC family transcriptional regulator for asnA, asnC and gidA
VSPSKGLKLDALDRKILKHLALHGKEGVRYLARELNRSPSTISERIRRLEREGIVVGYTALFNYSVLGYEINAITLLQVDGQYIEELEKELTSEGNVRGVYDITGEYDVALITSFRSVDELDAFIKRLIKDPRIKRSMTSLIFRVVKEKPHVDEFLKNS